MKMGMVGIRIVGQTVAGTLAPTAPLVKELDTVNYEVMVDPARVWTRLWGALGRPDFDFQVVGPTPGLALLQSSPVPIPPPAA
jgi:hypothetical protein